jgi:CHAD domain-containing protein
VRRILWLPYQTLLLNVAGALDGRDREALHDLRIAIRRLRTVLRAFRKPLAGTSAARLERDLQQLNRVLGAARDLDVWIGFFADDANVRQFTGHRLWAGFVAHQVELRRLQQVTVRRHLQGAGFLGLRLRLGHLLRVELTRAVAGGADPVMLGPARQALRRALREAMERGHWRLSPEPDRLHRFRILLRRVRYLAALLGPVLGRSVRKLGKRAHALERVLGGMRDADLALARIRQEGPTPPRPLLRHIEGLRRAESSALEHAWARLQERPFLLEIHRVLKG